MPPKKQVEPPEVRITAYEVLPAIEAIWQDTGSDLPQADMAIIRSGESANRRMWTPEALAEAVARDFWGNTPMFVDHGEKNAPRKRRFDDLRARIEPGTSYIAHEAEGDVVRAKVTFMDRGFADKVKAAGPVGGLSAVNEFLGQRFRGSDGHMHEKVHRLVVNHSVDFVAYPAAGGGDPKWITAMESEGDVDWSRLTDSDWESMPEDLLRTKRPDLLTAAESDEGEEDPTKVIVEVPPKKPDEPKPDEGKQMIALESVQSYVAEEVGRQVNAITESQTKKEAAREQVVTHVAKSALKPLAQADVVRLFAGQESYDQKAVQSAIDHELAKINESKLRGPIVKGMGDSQPMATTDSDAGDALEQHRAYESQFDYTPLSGKSKTADEGAAAAAGKAN